MEKKIMPPRCSARRRRSVVCASPRILRSTTCQPEPPVCPCTRTSTRRRKPVPRCSRRKPAPQLPRNGNIRLSSRSRGVRSPQQQFMFGVVSSAGVPKTMAAPTAAGMPAATVPVADIRAKSTFDQLFNSEIVPLLSKWPNLAPQIGNIKQQVDNFIMQKGGTEAQFNEVVNVGFNRLKLANANASRVLNNSTPQQVVGMLTRGPIVTQPGTKKGLYNLPPLPDVRPDGRPYAPELPEPEYLSAAPAPSAPPMIPAPTLLPPQMLPPQMLPVDIPLL